MDEGEETCGKGNSYQARPPVGGWGNPWDHAGSRANPNISNKEPRTKQAGTRRGGDPQSGKTCSSGRGGGHQALRIDEVLVAAPVATEGDGPRKPETLSK